MDIAEVILSLKTTRMDIDNAIAALEQSQPYIDNQATKALFAELSRLNGKPKARRTRKPRSEPAQEHDWEAERKENLARLNALPSPGEASEEKPKRRPGRPRKAKAEDSWDAPRMAQEAKAASGDVAT